MYVQTQVKSADNFAHPVINNIRGKDFMYGIVHFHEKSTISDEHWQYEFKKKDIK